MVMDIKKKKRVLLLDKMFDWLQIWMAASSLEVKGNKQSKRNLFNSLTSQVFPGLTRKKSCKYILCNKNTELLEGCDRFNKHFLHHQPSRSNL